MAHINDSILVLYYNPEKKDLKASYLFLSAPKIANFKLNAFNRNLYAFLKAKDKHQIVHFHFFPRDQKLNLVESLFEEIIKFKRSPLHSPTIKSTFNSNCCQPKHDYQVLSVEFIFKNIFLSS
jgi:hypothetical protein